MGNYRVVLSSAANLDEAKKIAKSAVEKRLCACVNIIPNITSIYEWRGEVMEESEYLLLFKTVGDNIDMLEEHIKMLHSYEVPEFIVLKIEEGSKEYLEWIDKLL